ncbi:nucleolar protein 14 [Cerioporus squamosus]|nr:nucleolar protein 14 [Cerioporus squamosus]
MAKGSQLKQLKSALQDAGLAQQPQAGKKRKRAAPTERDKEKKAARLREIQQKLNPFDVKVTKVKHDVGGRKITGTTGRPAQSKQAGIEQRKKTLLKEFEEKDRSGGIVDRRFGENDPTMAPEERMLERFTRERQRASKGTAFNLEDEDELTHYGQSLSKLDDFDNVGLGLDDDDEEEGQMDKRTVERSHFGGFGEDEDEGDEDEDEPARKKSKAEVMAEVIAKSKQHKILRQTQQEEDENLRHELDQELDSIRSLLFAAPLAENPAEPSTDGPAAPAAPLPEDQDKEYDQAVRELALDRRAKPKDRTKTEEELALEEKEALEKAERRRLRRMRGEESESEDEQQKGKRKQTKPRGGDDLEDDFVDEEQDWGGLGAGLRDDISMGRADEEGEDSEEDEDEEDGSEEGDDDDADEDGSVADEFESAEEDSGEEDGEEGESEALVETKRARRTKSVSATKELPYTFPCPETHDEFLEIIEDIDEKDVPTVLKRIRTLHHPSLAEENKFKLQGLNNVLIEHILYITSPPTPRHTVLASLLPHLAALTKSYPIQSAEAFVEKLSLMHKNLKRGLSKGALDPEAKTWPGIPELSLLRVIGQLWPTSDLNHPVISPARLLMGAYLGLGRIRSLQDIASGLFLCSLLLHYEKLSKRFVPEAINFLVNSVLHLAPHSYASVDSLPGSFPALDFRTASTLPLAIDIKKAKKLSVNKPDLTKSLCQSRLGEQEKVDLLGLSLELLSRFADMYKGLDGFVELFTPLGGIIAAVKNSSLPSELSTRMQSLQDTVGRMLKFALQAPHTHPDICPKFEHTTSNYLRNRDPDHERNEAAKLRAQYKQERKGAIRELRKDARFLAAEQQKKQKEKDRAYNERMKRVFGSIESERAEEKALEREKMKEKRRAGRK